MTTAIAWVGTAPRRAVDTARYVINTVKPRLTLFPSLHHARVTLAAWRTDYDTERPHSRLGWQTPADFA